MSTLSITIIQSNLHWENKEANLKMFADKISSISNKTELVILPEMFSTGFSMNPSLLSEKMEGPSIAWMKNIASSKRIILTGSLIIEEDGKFYNRLIWMLPNGQFAWYDKRHRFGFAGEDRYYDAGNKRLIASVNGWKINLQVCYDLRFPVWSRQNSRASIEQHSKPEAVDLGKPEFDCLIYVANWPERRNLAWKTLLQARAIENQCFVIGVNRVGNDGNNIYHSGNSMIIAPMGEILYTREHEEDIYTYTLQKDKLDEVRNKYPFLKDADDFFIEI